MLRLLAAARLALNFRLLLLAALALAGTVAGWRILAEMFANTDNTILQREMEANGIWPWESQITPLQPGSLWSPETWQHVNPLMHSWDAISKPFVQIYRSDVTLTQWTYWLCCALWSLAIWAFFGGAITRIAAVSFARHENVSWTKVGNFVRPRWISYFFAPLMPMLVTFMGAAVLALVGLLTKSEAGLLAAGILWPIVLVGGFIMAFLLIGLFFSWPLMWAAISTEGTDAFGALSHAYAYVYQRPLRYFLYGVLAALVGVLGWFVVTQFAYWILQLSYWGVSWGGAADGLAALSESQELGRLGNTGVQLIRFWNGLLTTLALAYVFSYFWVATTVIYFLLRREVDATELDDVFLPEEQQLHGLPPLKTDPDGMVEPADDGPAAADERASSNGG
ncbi:MAG: hypothetical protein WD845_15475 [Pirellulales bacterium]